MPAPAGAGSAPEAIYTIPQSETDADRTGLMGSYQPAGPSTSANAFFQPLGQNGRTCYTCHQPENAMSINTTAIQALFAASGDTAPLFAAIDGADCPNRPHAHSLLLQDGLFRIALPLPPNAEFTLSVVSDPTTCNTSPAYNRNAATGQTIVSVFRRPRPAANLKFVAITAADAANSNVAAVDPMTKLPLARDTVETAGVSDAFPGQSFENGNLMADGREPTLTHQAIDAVLGHEEATTPPTAAQINQMLAFEKGFYSAQILESRAGSLNVAGAHGGPAALSAQTAGLLSTAAFPTFSEFAAWTALAQDTTQAEQRASIARGMAIFNTRVFTIDRVAGLNNVPLGNGEPLGSVQGTCASCHDEIHSGTSSIPDAQLATGIGGDADGVGGPAPSPKLPIFKLTCSPAHPPAFKTSAGARANPPYVLTNDPGKALITGKCADIGRATVSPLRGLAARAPYFSDGSAPDLRHVVTFYNRRFHIGLSATDFNDLINFMNAL